MENELEKGIYCNFHFQLDNVAIIPICSQERFEVVISSYLTTLNHVLVNKWGAGGFTGDIKN